MKIVKILNNNIVIAQNVDGTDIILMGCGIGFQMKYGDFVDQSKIERIFTKGVSDLGNKFELLIRDIPTEYIDICDKIIQKAKIMLEYNLDDNIYISLTDHIYFAIKRIKAGMEFHNKLVIDTKLMYRNEFKAGLEAIKLIKDEFNIVLPEDEAAFIALHFVNASMGFEMKDTIEVTKIIQQVQTIIRNYYQIKLDEDSLNFFRLITHLKFFAKRMVSKESLNDNNDKQLLKIVKQKYIKASQCVNKIRDFIKLEYKHELTISEELYLTIHIERISKDFNT